jgi:hypothetical protein
MSQVGSKDHKTSSWDRGRYPSMFILPSGVDTIAIRSSRYIFFMRTLDNLQTTFTGIRTSLANMRRLTIGNRHIVDSNQDGNMLDGIRVSVCPVSSASINGERLPGINMRSKACRTAGFFVIDLWCELCLVMGPTLSLYSTAFSPISCARIPVSASPRHSSSRPLW